MTLSSSSPMAEATDSSPVQSEFESRGEDNYPVSTWATILTEGGPVNCYFCPVIGVVAFSGSGQADTRLTDLMGGSFPDLEWSLVGREDEDLSLIDGVRRTHTVASSTISAGAITNAKITGGSFTTTHSMATIYDSPMSSTIANSAAGTIEDLAARLSELEDGVKGFAKATKKVGSAFRRLQHLVHPT